MQKTLFGSESRTVTTYDKKRGLPKPVLQIKDGIVIKRFESIGEAARQTNILAPSISDVCRGKNRTTGGYVWKYAEFDMPVVAKRVYRQKATAIKKEKKGPFRIIITELCDSEKDAKDLLEAFSNGSKQINVKNAKIIQTRNRNKGEKHV